MDGSDPVTALLSEMVMQVNALFKLFECQCCDLQISLLCTNNTVVLTTKHYPIVWCAAHYSVFQVGCPYSLERGVYLGNHYSLHRLD
jgi:hypothetical protein